MTEEGSVLDAYRRAHDDVVDQISAALAPLGLEVSAAEAKGGGLFWTLQVAPIGMTLRPGEATGLLMLRESDLWDESVGRSAGEADAPVIDFEQRAIERQERARPATNGTTADAAAPVQRRDPTAGKRRPEVRPGETTGELLARGEPGLVLDFRRGEGGIGGTPMSPTEAGRMLAGIFVGDAFLELRHLKVDEAGEYAVGALQDAWRIYANEARHLGVPDRDAFEAALNVWAPAFPTSELRFDVPSQGGN